MRLAIIITAAGLLVGCSNPVVLVFPGVGSASRHQRGDEPRVPDNCRYSSMVVTHSLGSGRLASRDLELSARVAELMSREFRRLGARVTKDPNDAYWSLMVMAAHDDRHYEGFLFSATLALRQLHEGHDPGVTAYSGAGKGAAPTMYSGLGYGPGYELQTTVRSFVERADAALLPMARSLCQQEASEREREARAKRLVPAPIPL